MNVEAIFSWQDARTVKIYENEQHRHQRQFASNAPGKPRLRGALHRSGRVQVADGLRLGGWVNSTPLTSGAYLSLRTNSSDFSF